MEEIQDELRSALRFLCRLSKTLPRKEDRDKIKYILWLLADYDP